jgi:DNA-binding beta-propeller fold protein YncE
LDRGWTSNGQADSVTVFKLSTLEVVKVIKVTGKNPDAILFDPATKRVFTFNGGGKNATVIDAATSEVVGTIPMGGKPEFSACDGQGRVFVNNEDTSEILAIDAKAMKVVATWSIKPVEEPSGLALDVKNNFLFSVGGNHLAAVVDAVTGKVLATVPIGSPLTRVPNVPTQATAKVPLLSSAGMRKAISKHRQCPRNLALALSWTIPSTTASTCPLQNSCPSPRMPRPGHGPPW